MIERKEIKFLVVWVFISLVAINLYVVLIHRALAFEGIYRFILLLKDGKASIVIVARTYSHYIMQLPILVALWVGVKDPYILSVLWGVGVFVIPLVFIFIASLLLMSEKKDLFPLPFLAYGISHFCNTFYSSTETTVAHSMFWVFFAILYSNKIYKKKWLFLVIPFLLLLTFKLHEGFAFFNIILIMVVLLKTIQFNMIKTKQWHIILPTIFVLIFGIFFSITGTIYHQFVGCKENYVKSLIYFFQNKTIVFICVTTFIMFIINLFISKTKHTICLGFLIGIMLGIWLLYINYGFTFRSYHRNARVMNFIVPLLFSSIIVIRDFLNQNKHTIIFSAQKLCIPLIVVTFLNISNEVGLSYKWHEFTKTFARELRTKEGIVDINKTDLPKLGFSGDQYTNGLTIAIAGIYGINPLKSAIKINDYYPWNPIQVKKIPELEKYGIFLSYSDKIN